MATFRLPAERTSRFYVTLPDHITPSAMLEVISRPNISTNYRLRLICDALALSATGRSSPQVNLFEHRLSTWSCARDVIGFILEVSDEDFYADPPLIRSQWEEGADYLDTMNDWIDDCEEAREAMDRFVSSRKAEDLNRIVQRSRGSVPTFSPTPLM